jgi:hypothetical protein
LDKLLQQSLVPSPTLALPLLPRVQINLYLNHLQ